MSIRYVFKNIFKIIETFLNGSIYCKKVTCTIVEKKQQHSNNLKEPTSESDILVPRYGLGHSISLYGIYFLFFFGQFHHSLGKVGSLIAQKSNSTPFVTSCMISDITSTQMMLDAHLSSVFKSIKHGITRLQTPSGSNKMSFEDI